jgi:hypothetical protein
MAPGYWRANPRADVDASVATMRQRGLRVTALTPELAAEWQGFAESIYPRIRGTVVPAATFDEVVRLLKDYRSGSRP